jgi:hypothetical protein
MPLAHGQTLEVRGLYGDVLSMGVCLWANPHFSCARYAAGNTGK